MSDLVVARNCCIARMPLPEKPSMNRSARECVKRLERSKGLDTALYIL